MSFVPVDVYVKDSLPVQNPVAGVVVRVFDINGATVYTQATTDADGHAGFLLPDSQTYQVRFYKLHCQFTNPQYIAVVPLPGTNVFDVQAQVFEPPAAVDPRLCRASGFFRDVTGAPATDVDVQIIAKFNPLLLEGSAVVTERVNVRTDKDGYLEVDLIRNGQYNVTVSGMEDVVRMISVPDAPSCNLPDLIFPVVGEVSFDPEGPYALTLGGDDVPITPTIITTAGSVLEGTALGDVIWASSDPTIFVVLPTATQLMLRPQGAGTAQLLVTRQDQTIVRIPDTPIQGQPMDVVVT